MVTRVVGEVNGSSIVFTRSGGESWTAKVPLTEDGEWIVGLYAYDNAGNSTYLARILYAVTGHELTIKILDKGYIGRLEELGLSGFIKDDGYAGDVEDRGYIGSLVSCSDKHKDGGI